MATARKKTTGKSAASKTAKARNATTGRIVAKAVRSGRTVSTKQTSVRTLSPGSGATVAAGTKSVASKRQSRQGGHAAPSQSRAGASWQPQQRAKFVVEAVGGTRRTADLLEVSPSQPSRWVSGVSVPGPAQARMLVDLEHVLTHALLVWADVDVARDWLTSSNAHLDGARPVDWIRVNGTAEVVDALRAEAAGAYA